MSRNLVGPSLNTTCCNFYKEGFIYSVGINKANFLHIADVLLSVKKILNITGLIAFECSKDETAAIPLATWNTG